MELDLRNWAGMVDWTLVNGSIEPGIPYVIRTQGRQCIVVSRQLSVSQNKTKGYHRTFGE